MSESHTPYTGSPDSTGEWIAACPTCNGLGDIDSPLLEYAVVCPTCHGDGIVPAPTPAAEKPYVHSPLVTAVEPMPEHPCSSCKDMKWILGRDGTWYCNTCLSYEHELPFPAAPPATEVGEINRTTNGDYHCPHCDYGSVQREKVISHIQINHVPTAPQEPAGSDVEITGLNVAIDALLATEYQRGKADGAREELVWLKDITELDQYDGVMIYRATIDDRLAALDKKGER